MEFNFYKGTAVNKGGEMPWIDVTTNTAYMSKESLVNRCDNIEALEIKGINNIVISIYPDKWHIEQVGGYTHEDGLFTIVQ